MNLFPAIKVVSELAVSYGVGAVIGNAIKATTPANLNLIGKISVGVGSVALAGVIGELTANHVGAKIDIVASNFGKTTDIVPPTED